MSGQAGLAAKCDADDARECGLPRRLTGFTGSAGAAIVLSDRAAIFVDGRYLLQVRDQIDTALFAVEHLVENPPDKWLDGNLPMGGKA